MTIIMVKMAGEPPFKLIYDPEVKRHLRAIDAKQFGLIRGAIEQQLTWEPFVEARNRKPLKRPVDFEAEWELRISPDNRFRVFYSIDPHRREVQILAIGVKEGNRLKIGGVEVEL